METLQTECKRCGTCCEKGGPALHKEDREIILSARVSLENLITIRRGELANNPITARLEPVQNEFIKIRGKGREWSCIFFGKDKFGCQIYRDRPLACRALECWNTDELLSLVGKDTLTRLEVIKEDDPLRPLVEEHEQKFPCPDLEKLADELVAGSFQGHSEIQGLADSELQYRTRAVKKHGLTLHRELFYFGRPIFQLLQPLGIKINETTDGIQLHWPNVPT